MRRLLPLFLWIALYSCALCGYSRDLTVSVSLIKTRTSNFLQATTVTGKVADEGGVGMPGVNVLVQGTANGTTTDSDGMYRLSIPPDQAAGTLVFSFIGYANQEIPILNRSTINVTMMADVKSLTEVVVVGYGTQEKRDVTAAISQISGEAITK